ncbi:MAG: hypothetical protein ABR563_11655 [Pyrinomonadaceae bacterium]
MPVVVDEMQVEVAEPPQQQHQTRGGDSSSGGGRGGGAGQPPEPEEVARAMRTHLERAERVWAY